METSSPGLLSKSRIFVGPNYNRWLVPPCALAIHLCIGMAYGFSVFWFPLSEALGITKHIDCPKDLGFFQSLINSTCDWSVASLGWMFILFFVFLGSSAAIWGGWLERAGPRKAGVIAALCWGGGFFVSAVGIYYHQLWIVLLGSGVIGGVGLGLGYISPVSTLIKWFPDRRGMATGMAIMGFGGGAMIGSPLAAMLMKHFATPTSVGVFQTFIILGIIYFIFMMGGAFGYRLPAPNWKPAGWIPRESEHSSVVDQKQVHVNVAIKTPQFWLVWLVLTLNVTAGIGIIGMASPMLQEIFAGKLIGITAIFTELTTAQKAQIAIIAAGFTGLLSLFNIIGRFFWASLSDYLGRKLTYATFFTLGFILYATAPISAEHGQMFLFVLGCCIILSMYGGGFATVPAYLADLFGTQMVGAIHGRLITAWSAAGIFGPIIVNYMRSYQLKMHIPNADVYDNILYVMAGLLVLGFICNLMIKPVDKKYYMTAQELEAERKISHEITPDTAAVLAAKGDKPSSTIALILAWLAVGIPLAWGFTVVIKNTLVLFK